MPIRPIQSRVKSVQEGQQRTDRLQMPGLFGELSLDGVESVWKQSETGRVWDCASSGGHAEVIQEDGRRVIGAAKLVRIRTEIFEEREPGFDSCEGLSSLTCVITGCVKMGLEEIDMCGGWCSSEEKGWPF